MTIVLIHRAGVGPCDLDASGNVVLIALIARTCCTIGKVVGVQVEACDWDSVDRLESRLGEGKRSAEVSGEECEGVEAVTAARSRREEAVRGASHPATVSLIGGVRGSIPGDDLPELTNVIRTGLHLQLAVRPGCSIPLKTTSCFEVFLQ